MSIATSLSALDKALSLSRQIAGKAVQGGGGSLQSPARPIVPPGTETRAHAIRDRLELSEQARRLQEEEAPSAAAPNSANPLQLSDEEKIHVRELQARDAEVRAHENAHAAAGGALAGAPSYQYQQGPDGRLYAVGGEVPIQVKEGATPEETLRNAAQVRRAALAPANPSSADQAVAATAASLEMKARAELAEERLEEVENAGRRGADVAEVAVGEGGSFDSRIRGYMQPPAPAIDVPQISLFG